MLNPDQSNRCTASEILEHAWIKNAKNLSPEVLPNFETRDVQQTKVSGMVYPKQSRSLSSKDL